MGMAEEAITVSVTVVSELYIGIIGVWSGTGLVPAKLGQSSL